MTLRLGFVGVGRWARKLAESFRACGAKIVAYDRKSGAASDGYCFGYGRCTLSGDGGHDPWCTKAGTDRRATRIDGFGKFIPWRDQLTDKSIDAIVAVAPPEVTTEVAMACAAAGKPVMATKPLFDHPERITAPFYVDFWRLWSEAHASAKASDAAVSLVLKGSGPVRDFPGMFDYGPHVVAATLDIAGPRSVRLVDQYHQRGTNDDGVYMAQWVLGGELAIGGTLVDAEFGNGAEIGARSVSIHQPGSHRDAIITQETPTHIGDEPKEAIMQKFCSAFLSDVSEGFVSTTLLDYSREGMRLLREIREKAT